MPKRRRHFVYRNLARTETYFIKNMRVSLKQSGGGIYNPSDVYENFHYIRPRFKWLPFNKHSIFKRDLSRRLKGYRLAQISNSEYVGDICLELTYLHPKKVSTIQHNIRKMLKIN